MIPTPYAAFATHLVAFVLAAVASAAEPPRLVVVVSVDQFAYDYLARFSDNFSDQGLFRRVAAEGASYLQCHHQHAYTYTAPGHAVQLTGTYPRAHGVIDNEWFDRQLGRVRYCVEDKSVRVLGATSTKGMSPRSLLVDTVGDRLKQATGGKAKVFGVAIKDRASILMTGHKADAAFWLDANQWVTTDYYRPDLPGYLRVLNEGRAIERFHGQRWELLLPLAAYHNVGPDKNDWESPPRGLTSEFPHILAAAGAPPFKDATGQPIDPAKTFGDQVLASPFGNDYTLEAAREVLRGEALGTDDTPDLLCINLSSNDYVGHAFGPHSHEVEDMTYRTDRQLGEFARFVDQQVGAGRWTFCLTADHAVAPVPAYARKYFNLDAERAPLPKPRIAKELEERLRLRLGVAAGGPTLVQSTDEFQVYLRHDHPALAGRLAEARRIAREWVAEQPRVHLAVTLDQLDDLTQHPLLPALRRAAHAERSGDVLWVFDPYVIPGDRVNPANDRGTTHGSPWPYDTHVPLLLFGSGIVRGRFERPVSPACLASTVAGLVGVPAPAGNVESPLHEALGK